ncbi:MAG: bifunctional 2-C-methyl-D-erythritol 4-phosphate cytidylyltransferase/2-C-methyl-D-erythritol 2,4-cyclodiphosphate synthase [Rhizobiales bacterium 32-66-11]|nr:MAG: bifunctional 2-C-methyl-D-erythritol 4-phosphate cytidylyltransferase/2-C-methyl-D-erythritol 2,4-cyclodiphosphate synthase [Rhizobiales bacterium 32-66-11]
MIFMATCAVIVVAAGRGTRAGGPLPKQYHEVGGETVLRRTLRLFAEHSDIHTIQVVIHPDDHARFASAAAGLEKVRPPVAGGRERQDSVRAGLEALAGEAPDLVLVHDAARPFVTHALISRAVEAAAAHGAAVPVTGVTDTIKVVDALGTVASTPVRATLRAVQTPQAFRYDMLRAAHDAAQAGGIAGLTDDAAVMEWLTDVRTGTGFDVHAFGPGDHVMLGGLAIPFDKGLDGHSDADVGLHALTDAVLGALCDGDIGAHFPPSDPQWKGATSDRFLVFALDKVRARGGIVAHLDLTLICEAPKIGPHRDAIRARISEITGVALGRISVKATTTERLGFTGRREGIAAMASATIRLPEEDLL